jgi:hypothetical protein
LLAAYGLPSAESRLAAGSEMYRVFMFDAWMNSHVAVTVERSPGAPPTLTLHAPRPPERRDSAAEVVPPLSVPISADQWHDLRRRGSLFEKSMVPEQRPAEPGSIDICMGHGPAYFVESADAAAIEEQRLRRSERNHCEEGLAEPFAIEVALLAAEAIPACAVLDEALFNSLAVRLRACAGLSGDQVAAAHVYNLMRLLLADRRDRPSVDQLSFLFRGAEVGGPGAVSGADLGRDWLQAISGSKPTRFVVERIHGDDARHVTVDGWLRRRGDVGDDDARPGIEDARVQILWTMDELGDFRAQSLSIGRFEPRLDLCNASGAPARSLDC